MTDDLLKKFQFKFTKYDREQITKFKRFLETHTKDELDLFQRTDPDKFDLNSKDKNGNTLLHNVFREYVKSDERKLLGRKSNSYMCSMLKLAIKLGFDIESRNNEGETLLLHICRHLKHPFWLKGTDGGIHDSLIIDLIKRFVNIGFNINDRDFKGDNILSKLFASQAVSISRREGIYFEIIRCLYTSHLGLDYYLRDGDGFSPVHLFIYHISPGNLLPKEVIKSIVVSDSVKNKDDIDFVDLAEYSLYDSVVDQVVSKYTETRKDPSLLLSHFQTWHLKNVGLPIVCVDNFGNTPFHIACASCSPTKIVHLFCYYSDDELLARNEFGKTGFDCYLEAIKLIISAVKKCQNWAPVVKRDVIDRVVAGVYNIFRSVFCERLKERVIEEGLTDENKSVLLFVACRHGDLEMARGLIKSGVRPDVFWSRDKRAMEIYKSVSRMVSSVRKFVDNCEEQDQEDQLVI